MQVMDQVRNDATKRLILEAVRINSIPEERRINDKEEWIVGKIPAVRVTSQWPLSDLSVTSQWHIFWRFFFFILFPLAKIMGVIKWEWGWDCIAYECPKFFSSNMPVPVISPPWVPWSQCCEVCIECDYLWGLIRSFSLHLSPKYIISSCIKFHADPNRECVLMKLSL